MDKETIDFAIALTGHDEQTIKQMYRDWVRNPSSDNREKNMPEEYTENKLPDLGEAVWLNDYHNIWIGCRDMVDAEHWLFGNSYGHFWHDGERWVCDNEIDDDYQPICWKPLPGFL